MEKFRFEKSREGDVEKIKLFGYLENSSGAELKKLFDARLQDGALKYIIDFSGIELISSPGVAALLDIGSRIVDDFDGKISCYGIDSHHLAVLEMSGLFFLVAQAANEAEALKQMKE
ncbi:MAG: STAS domain-containing protein [Candidatus Riflebacteria bacterium]|nr:STAS domain-containing protein [Candidatus Riflebacteria bacterium]